MLNSSPEPTDDITEKQEVTHNKSSVPKLKITSSSLRERTLDCKDQSVPLLHSKHERFKLQSAITESEIEFRDENELGSNRDNINGNSNDSKSKINGLHTINHSHVPVVEDE